MSGSNGSAVPVRSSTGRRWWFVLGIAAGLAVAAVGTWQVRRALAEGVPASSPLFFGGTLTEDGVPVEGTREVTVEFFDAESGGATVCTTAATGTAVRAGRFRIPLDAACTAAVRAAPDVWIGVTVGGTPLPGRMKIGAVPYALEAGRAASAGGALEARIAALEAAAGVSGALRPCPEGMVEVGTFCIDKYEASIWSVDACGGPRGTQYGIAGSPYPAGFPPNGDFSTPLYACSVPDVVPSAGMTWFQAQQACIASAKRLCTNAEWQAAVTGTHDPGAHPGSGTGSACTAAPADGRCNTCANAPRRTGRAGSRLGGIPGCVSTYGAEDMIGNLTEWTADWGVGFPIIPVPVGPSSLVAVGRPWPVDAADSYGNDTTINVNSWAGIGFSGGDGRPAVAVRGGDHVMGEDAGAFHLSLQMGPTDTGNGTTGNGFRCCRDR